MNFKSDQASGEQFTLKIGSWAKPSQAQINFLFYRPLSLPLS
jgi:hypothetical protein